MEDMEISLNDILKVLKKHWKLIILPTIVVGLLAHIYAHNLPKEYESSALIKIGYIGQDQLDSVGSITAIMSSEQLRKQVAIEAGHVNDLNYIQALTGMVQYSDESGMLKITAKTQNPVTAKQLADIVAKIVIERHKIGFDNGKIELNQMVNFVKENIRPIPLSSGIREFRLVPSELVITASVPNHAKESKMPIVRVSVLISFLLLSMLALFKGKDIISKKSC
ncbi:MAG: Wzz/FepE/Etk N-terminal domain-containing protein [Endomicrobiales bacterium]|nr:Wzz/FepE/Etk N-terminal domain-containing protein [Endomicrobiales bacterium]